MGRRRVYTEEFREQARRLVAEKRLTWPQVYLGSMAESTTARQYGVGAIPMMVLIDTDGKILAKEADATQMQRHVEAALGKAR